MNTDAIHKLSERIRADKLSMISESRQRAEATENEIYLLIPNYLIGLELFWLGLFYLTKLD